MELTSPSEMGGLFSKTNNKLVKGQQRAKARVCLRPAASPLTIAPQAVTLQKPAWSSAEFSSALKVFEMQRLLVTVAIVAAIALSAPVSEVEAQSNSKPVVAPRTINLTAEQSFIIKEIVLKDLNVPKAQAGAPESIGDSVPSGVGLHDMTPTLAEKVPQAKSHKFYVTAHAVVLVNLSDRKIADVIKLDDAKK